MTTLKINSKDRTIEMTKKFANEAKRFGTAAYKDLQTARADYPDYRVVTKSTRKKKGDNFKGLTYGFMENYIKLHDDDNGSTSAKFNVLRATSEEAKILGAESASYHEIKEWFFEQYPAFADFQKKREDLLKKSAA